MAFNDNLGYNRAPPSQQQQPARPNGMPSGDAFGQRVTNRSEHSGVQDRSSTRIHAAPGGRSNLSLSDGSSASQFAGRSDPPARARHDLYQQQPAPRQQQAPRSSMLDYNPQPNAYDPYSQQQQQQQYVPQQGYGGQPQPQQQHYQQQQEYYNPPIPYQAQPSASAAPLYCNEGGVHQGRSSTRIAAPPGGHSSFSFGNDPPARAAPPQQAYAPPPPQYAAAQPYGYENDALSQHVAQVNSQYASRSNTPTHGQQRQGAHGGAPPGQSAQPVAEALYCGEGGVMRGRSSTRVAAPPGGRSSFTFGNDAPPAQSGYVHPRSQIHTSGRPPLVLG